MKKTECRITINPDETLKLKGDVFIIPNGFARVQDFLVHNNRFAKNITQNGPGWNITKEPLVECWIVSKDLLDSDNVADHGFYAMYKGEERYCRIYNASRFIPARIFKDAKEGDTVTWKCDIEIMHWKCCFDDVKVVPAEFELTLKQLTHRYPQHGTFEATFKYLLDYWAEHTHTNIENLWEKCIYDEK